MGVFERVTWDLKLYANQLTTNEQMTWSVLLWLCCKQPTHGMLVLIRSSLGEPISRFSADCFRFKLDKSCSHTLDGK